MTMPTDPQAVRIDRRRVADQILDDLRNQILSGALPSGARLPAERELATHYGVSGPTIREALRVLTTMGLIDSRNGSRSTVTARSDTLMSVSISSVIQFEKVGAPDVFNLLGLLNAYAAQLAVERATPDEVASFRQAAERAVSVEDVRHGGAELRDFFHTLSAISHHPLLAALCRAIVDMQIELAIKRSSEQPERWNAVACRLRNLRMEIVEAVEGRDATRAVALVRDYHARTLDLLGAASTPGRGKPAMQDSTAMIQSRTSTRRTRR